MKNEEKTRVATYIEKDICKWLRQEATRNRITESALIRQILAKEMNESNTRGE